MARVTAGGPRDVRCRSCTAGAAEDDPGFAQSSAGAASGKPSADLPAAPRCLRQGAPKQVLVLATGNDTNGRPELD